MYYRIKFFIVNTENTGVSTTVYRSLKAAKKAATLWEANIPNCKCEIIEI